MKTRTRILCAAALAAALLSAPTTAGAHEGPALDPESVDTIILPGESYEVEKTVHTPGIPPKIDVCLLEDETGSFLDDIGNLQGGTTAADIYTSVTSVAPDSQFAVAGFRDFGDSFVYRLLSTMDPSLAAWQTGIAGLSASGGGDNPEAQYPAIRAAVVGGFGQASCGFRADPQVVRVLIVATDAEFHTGGAYGNEASTLPVLTANNVTVIGLKAPGAGGELDSLAAATGGTVQPLSSDGANIAGAILAGLGNLPVDVEMVSDCADPISTTFDPAIQTVTSGDDAVFTETISVAADAPGGVYACQDWALLNGDPMTDASGAIIYETKTLLVPENFVTGGGHITNGKKGKNRVNLLTFGGNAGYVPDGTLVGNWTFNYHDAGVKVHTTEITSLQFIDTGGNPAPPDADADLALMTAVARVNVGNGGWVDGCEIEALFFDGGEPQEDAVGVAINCPDFNFVIDNLTGGNIQIHEGTKG